MAENEPRAVDTFAGNIIRAQRKLLGLSQNDLGGAVGVSFQQIQKYERGFNRVSCSMLAKISMALQTPVSKFFPQDLNLGASDGEDLVAQMLASTGGLQLARVWSLMDDSERACMVHVGITIAGRLPVAGSPRLPATAEHGLEAARA